MRASHQRLSIACLLGLAMAAPGWTACRAGPGPAPPGTPGQVASSAYRVPTAGIPRATLSSATPTRQPSATSTPPARSPTPIYEPAGVFRFDRTVPSGYRAVVEAGVYIASEYLRQLDDVRTPRVSVFVYVDLASLDVPWEGLASQTNNTPSTLREKLRIFVGQAYPATIFINTGASGWRGLSAVHQMRLAAHEYFHAVQLDMVGAQRAKSLYTAPADTVSQAGPHWLLEGSAEFISWRAMESAGLVDLAAHLEALGDDLPAPAAMESFLGFYTHGQISYDASLDAVQRLIDDSNGELLLEYFRRISQGESWQSAFVSAFGVTSAEFYGRWQTASGSR